MCALRWRRSQNVGSSPPKKWVYTNKHQPHVDVYTSSCGVARCGVCVLQCVAVVSIMDFILTYVHVAAERQRVPQYLTSTCYIIVIVIRWVRVTIGPPDSRTCACLFSSSKHNRHVMPIYSANNSPEKYTCWAQKSHILFNYVNIMPYKLQTPGMQNTVWTYFLLIIPRLCAQLFENISITLPEP